MIDWKPRREEDKSIDPVLRDEVVLDLVRKYVPNAHNVKQVDESGNRARTYLVDEDLVLKTQRNSKIRPQTSLEKEVFFLNQMRADERIRVPRVLGYGIDDRDGSIEYTLMTRMPGTAARRLSLEGEERTRVLHDLGRTLRYIHGLNQKPLKESSHFQGEMNVSTVRDSIRRSYEIAVEQLGNRPPGWTSTITTEQAAERAIHSLPTHIETVALHANPGAQHTFVDPESKSFTGVIDFGDAYINHPAFDFASWRSAADQQAIFAGYISEAAVSEEFLKVWGAISILQMLRNSIRGGSAVAREDLQYWLNQL